VITRQTNRARARSCRTKPLRRLSEDPRCVFLVMVDIRPSIEPDSRHSTIGCQGSNDGGQFLCSSLQSPNLLLCRVMYLGCVYSSVVWVEAASTFLLANAHVAQTALVPRQIAEVRTGWAKQGRAHIEAPGLLTRTGLFFSLQPLAIREANLDNSILTTDSRMSTIDL
jgi:hypothetical protein